MTMEAVKLNNGVLMPVLGLGTFEVTEPAECIDSVKDALALGYRMVDTAQLYNNEEFADLIQYILNSFFQLFHPHQYLHNTNRDCYKLLHYLFLAQELQ